MFIEQRTTNYSSFQNSKATRVRSLQKREMSSSSKALIRTGISLMTRFAKPRPLRPPPPLNLSSAPNLYPCLYPQSQGIPHVLPSDDVDSIKKLSFQGFLYPCGLPSLPFFLPDGNDSTESEPLVLFPKRTYQPSNIRRKRNHGFLARAAKQQRVARELLLEELQRAGQESRLSSIAF